MNDKPVDLLRLSETEPDLTGLPSYEVILREQLPNNPSSVHFDDDRRPNSQSVTDGAFERNNQPACRWKAVGINS